MSANLLPPAASTPRGAGAWADAIGTTTVTYSTAGIRLLKNTAAGNVSHAYVGASTTSPSLGPGNVIAPEGELMTFACDIALVAAAPRTLQLQLQIRDSANVWVGTVQTLTVPNVPNDGVKRRYVASGIVPVGVGAFRAQPYFFGIALAVNDYIEADNFTLYTGILEELGPSAVVEIAFENNPFNSNPVWTDVSADVNSVTIERGRNSPSEDIGAGSATVELDNAAGKYTPLRAASPYFPYVLPNRRIRISAAYRGRFGLNLGSGALSAAHTAGTANNTATGASKPNTGYGLSGRAMVTWVSGPERSVWLRFEWLDVNGAVSSFTDGPAKVASNTGSTELTITADPPLFGAVTARLAIMVGAAASASGYNYSANLFEETIPEFDGYVERWPASLTDISTVTLQAFDGFSLLAQRTLGSPYSRAVDGLLTPAQKAGSFYYPLDEPSNRLYVTPRYNAAGPQYLVNGGIANSANPSATLGGSSALPRGSGGASGLEIKNSAPTGGGPFRDLGGTGLAGTNKFEIFFWYSGEPDSSGLNKTLFSAIFASFDPIRIQLGPTGAITATIQRSTGVAITASTAGGKYAIGQESTHAIYIYWDNVNLNIYMDGVSVGGVAASGGVLPAVTQTWLGFSSVTGVPGTGTYSHFMLSNSNILGPATTNILASYGYSNFEGEFVPARGNRILGYVAWPMTRVQITEASTRALTSGEWGAGDSALSALLDTSRSGDYLGFMSALGDVRLAGPTELAAATTFATYSGPSAVEPGATAEVDYQTIVNEVTVISANGRAITLSDATSQATYGLASGELRRDVRDIAALTATAQAYLTARKDPKVWLSELVFNPSAVASHRSILRLDLQSRITASDFPTSAPATSFDLRVEKITHTVTADGNRSTWETRILTSPF